HQIEQLDRQASPLVHLQRLSPDTPEQKLRDFLGGFDFRGDMATGPVAPLSGGEKARLVLAMLVWNRPNLLLLDEPTNHLDLDMRHALTVALQGFEGAVVTVSHDRHLLRNTVENYWLVENGTVARFDGDLDDYRNRLAREPGESAGGKNAASTDGRTRQRRRRADIKPLKNRVDRLNRDLEKASRALETVEAELAEPSIYEPDNHDRLQQLLARQAELRQRTGELESAWLEAAELLEAAET
ncbi:MAG: ATP-binding cassette domain-containing protein, partial [Wenzhouxiangella sp.]